MGGGYQYFCPKENETLSFQCSRSDGQNYIDKFLSSENITFVDNGVDLLKLTGDETSIVGLFSPSDMTYETEKNNGINTGEPRRAATNRVNLTGNVAMFSTCKSDWAFLNLP